MGDGMRSSRQQRPSQRQGQGSGRMDRDNGSRRDSFPRAGADERGEPAWGRQNPASSQQMRDKSSRSGDWDDRSRSGYEGGWNDGRREDLRWQSWDDEDGAEDERWGDARRGE